MWIDMLQPYVTARVHVVLRRAAMNISKPKMPCMGESRSPSRTDHKTRSLRIAARNTTSAQGARVKEMTPARTQK